MFLVIIYLHSNVLSSLLSPFSSPPLSSPLHSPCISLSFSSPLSLLPSPSSPPPPPLPRELRGVLVTLSSAGHLQCSYLGTDPSFFSTPKVDAREVDYEQLDAEMRTLQRFIREATRTQGMRTHSPVPSDPCP